MEREVSRGRLAPADFHRKKADLMASLTSGVDDGRSRTCGTLLCLAVCVWGRGASPETLSRDDISFGKEKHLTTALDV